MKNQIVIPIATALTVVGGPVALAQTVSPPPLFTLVWSDEFDGDALNPDNWTAEIGGGGFGNNELQFYTNRPDNLRVTTATDAGGQVDVLEIRAQEESFGGREYTSARINTKDKVEVQYGRIEARIKIPSGQGLWPAFWMLGAGFPEVDWPRAGEIDILEGQGRKPQIVFGSLHGPGYSGAESITARYVREADDTLAEGFHVYAIEWDPARVVWLVDGEVYQTRTTFDVLEKGDWVFGQPFFLLLNLAVGGDFVRPPNDQTPFPASLLVDYVRVYERTR